MSNLSNRKLQKMIELQYPHQEALEIIEFFIQKNLDRLVTNLIQLELEDSESCED